MTFRKNYMTCHRYAVIAVVEAGGGDIEWMNEALQEGSRGCVHSVGKVAPPSCVYFDAEHHAFFAVQV